MPPDAAPIRYLFATAVAVSLLVLFHVMQRVLTRSDGLQGERNTARLFVQAGHVAAVLLLVPGIVREALTHESLAESVGWATAFGIAGVALIHLVGELGIRLLMGARLARALEAGNVAVGVAAGANYVAVGILAAPAIAGSDLHGLWLSLVFFGIAVVTQAAYVVLFRALTVYDDEEQIAGENLAAAMSYAGVSVAVSLVLARAVTGGDFTGWFHALSGYAGVAVSAIALYPVRQIVVEGLVLGKTPTLRGGALDHAIGVDRNAGMAALEALAYLATASALVSLT